MILSCNVLQWHLLFILPKVLNRHHLLQCQCNVKYLWLDYRELTPLLFELHAEALAVSTSRSADIGYTLHVIIEHADGVKLAQISTGLHSFIQLEWTSVSVASQAMVSIPFAYPVFIL